MFKNSLTKHVYLHNISIQENLYSLHHLNNLMISLLLDITTCYSEAEEKDDEEEELHLLLCFFKYFL